MCVPSGRHGRDALPLDRFLALFERIRTVAEHVTLIGGEPFTYPWIFSREVAGRSHLRLILVYGVIRSTSSLTGLPAANPGRFPASSRPSSASLSLRGDVRPALPEALHPRYDRWRALQIEPPPG